MGGGVAGDLVEDFLTALDEDPGTRDPRTNVKGVNSALERGDLNIAKCGEWSGQETENE